MGKRFSFLAALAAAALVAAAAIPAGAASTGDTRVAVGSPSTPFSQNKQNEPALAVDANHPDVLVSGANDNIDMEACNAGTDNTCPFTPGVGVSGVYFSFNKGASWTQPTYTGFTGRTCLGKPGKKDPECTGEVGSIGTLPKYYDNGLVSDGDPALAFGPVPDSSGHFSWSNGSRLYYANLTSNFPGDATFKGDEAVAVSSTDDVQAAAAGKEDAWTDPVIASRQTSTTFSDKEQIWADNAASSKFFGNVYVCTGDFTGSGNSSRLALDVETSTDGGATWAHKHVIRPGTVDLSGCTVRTDSNGVVYVFVMQFASGMPGRGSHLMIKSYDGGKTWTKAQPIGLAVDTCFSAQFDGDSPRCVEDGVAGSRDDLSPAPSVDIANGAPTGSGATDEIVRSWVDGRDGVAHPHVVVSQSTNGGKTWTAATAAESAGDRGYYSAIAVSPGGTDAYLVYNAFTTPFRKDTTSSRGLVGVVKHADIASSGALGSWSTLHRGMVGDPRASAQNNLVLEFLGDYVYAVATPTYGAGVWNDMRNGAVCNPIQRWRAAVQDAVNSGTAIPAPPAPEQRCPAGFGNSDIYGGGFADPTP